MRTKIFIILIVIITVLIGGWAFISVQNHDSRTPQQILLDHYAQLHHFTGNVFLYYQGDTLIHESRGFSQLQPPVENDLNTQFAIGSVSKHFAAVLILLLEEEGKLSVEDRLVDHIEDLPGAWSKITLHHLLTHTSGIANSTEIFNTPEMLDQGRSVENSFKVIKETPLAFEPGSQFEYCNTGYNYLAMVVEAVTGKTFEENLEERIFQPLGMKNSGSISDFTLLDKLAQGFSTENNMLTPIKERGLVSELLKGAGAIFSNTHDLFVWDRALSENRLLSSRQTEKMFTPFLENYAYGWRIREIEANGKTYQQITHSGHVDGFMANFVRIPELDFCLIILSNSQDSPIMDLSNGLMQVSLNGALPDSFFLPVKTDLFAPYAGNYELEDGTVMKISFYDKGIQMETEGYPKLPFFPEGGHNFKSAYPFVPAKIRFITNQENVIIGMEFTYEDKVVVGTKINL
ncbi:MAG: serine hydrolase [Bacteroidetes bacterium]|nr:serine hydrolase [Bacteroidota bacterium]